VPPGGPSSSRTARIRSPSKNKGEIWSEISGVVGRQAQARTFHSADYYDVFPGLASQFSNTIVGFVCRTTVASVLV